MEERAYERSFPKAVGRYDRALNHVAGNQAMQNFLGNNLMVSLFKIVHPEDEAKLRNLIERCENQKEVREIIRMMNMDEEYESLIFKAVYDKEAELYDVILINAEECENVIDTLNGNIGVLRSFLTVENNILFQYDSKSSIFKLFWVSGSHDIELYRMNLEQWKNKMLELGYVEMDNDRTAFVGMCEAIKNLHNSEHSFCGKIITKGERVDTYRIKIKTVEDRWGNPQVVGRWNLINDGTGEAVDDFCEESYIDPLTDLLNKKSITELAKETVMDEHNKRVALAMLDLDNFKQVNDTYGHMFGDEVLKATGKIIKEASAGVAVAGRMGGDEFFLVFKDYVDEEHLRNVLRTIKLNIAGLYQGKIGDIKLSCSIGASRSDVDSYEYERLFKVADKALYVAKQKGKNRYIIYKTELHGEFKDEKNTQVEMKEAYYVESDIRDISRYIKNAIVNGGEATNILLERMAHVFHFDRIGIYSENGTQMEHEYCKEDVVEGSGSMIQNEKYLDMFENDIVVVENVNTLEYKIPEVYEAFHKQKTKSAIQILIRDSEDKPAGVISFENCSVYVTFPKKLVDYISVYGNILTGVAVTEK